MQPKLDGTLCKPQKLHADSANSKMGPQTFDGSANPRFQIVGMEPVQKQHRPDVVILDEPRDRCRTSFRFGQDRHQLGESQSVQVKHEGYKFARRLTCGCLRMRFEYPNQLFEPAQGLIQLLPIAGSHRYARQAPNIGECTVSIVVPLPRYICTPHGRHGSKLRTARMMSMPLKFSGPFSSKIGVPLTASS